MAYNLACPPNSSPLFWETIVFSWSDMRHQDPTLFSPFSLSFLFSFPLWLCYKVIYTQQPPSQDCFFFSFSFFFVYVVRLVSDKLFDPVSMGLFGIFTLNHIRSEREHNHAGSNCRKQNNPLLFGRGGLMHWGAQGKKWIETFYIFKNDFF